MRLLIVGRGIAGSSLARHAVERGHDVTIIADPDHNTASLAALCIVRADWFTDGPRDDALWSIEWYRKLGAITSESMNWRTYRKPGDRQRDGFVAINPLVPLVETPEFEVLRATWPIFDADPYDATVLCRGSGSDLDWKRRWGATSRWRSDIEAGMAAYEDRPRNALYVVSHGNGELRFGSSIANDPAAAVNRQIEAVITANALRLVPPANEIALTTTGIRLMPPKGVEAGLVRRLSGATWACEGFGRVGFSLAPARTYRLLRAIEQEMQ